MNNYMNLFDEDIRKNSIKLDKIFLLIFSFTEIILLVTGIFIDSFLIIAIFWIVIPIVTLGAYIVDLNMFGELIKIENDNLYVYKFNKKFKRKIDLKKVSFSNYNVLLYEYSSYGPRVTRECLVIHLGKLNKLHFFKDNLIDYKYCYKDDSVLVIHNKELIEYLIKNYIFRRNNS